MTMRRVLTAAVTAFVLFASAPAPAAAAELVMFETAGCPWCAKWHAEVGPGYPKSPEGQRAPLRVQRLETTRDGGVVLASPVTVSPTFVLVDQGREVGRVIGYPGADFFWGLLAQMIAKLDKVIVAPEQRAERAGALQSVMAAE
jgi:hypothetical protein